MLRVIGIDPDLGTIHGLSTGTGNILGPVFIGEQGAGFGHAIAHQIREIDFLEDALHFRVQGRTTHDEFLHIAAESLLQSLSDLFINQAIDPGNLEGQLHGRLVQHGFQLGFVNLLHYQGNGDQQIRLHIGKGLHKRSRRRGLAQPIDGRAVAQGIDKLDYQAVHVGHGQHGDHLVARRYVALTEIHIRAEIAIGQHHAFRVSGRAGSIIDRAQVVPVIGREMDEFLLVSVRIFLGKGGIQVLVRLGEGRIVAIEQIPGIHIHRHAQPGHFGHIQFGPFIGVGKKHYAFGMIHQIADTFRRKIGQNRDNHGLVGIHSHIGHSPAGAVTGT